MAKKSNLIVFLGQKFQSNTSVCVLVFQIGLWKKTVPVSKSLLVKCWSRPAVLFVIQAVQHYEFEMFLRFLLTHTYSDAWTLHISQYRVPIQ